MKTYQLSAQPRTELGKRAAKNLRAENLIPVVLNGGEIIQLPFTGTLKPGEKLVEVPHIRDKKKLALHKPTKGMITTDLVVKQEDVRNLIYTPDIFAIELDINGEKRMAVLKDIQFQPVKDTILHIDLLEVNDTKPVEVEVPVRLEGHAEGVKAGGKLQLQMKKLRVKAIYTDIPERLVINVDNLGLGKTLSVGDLHFDKLELMNAKNAVVCAVQLTRAARGAAAAAAAGK